MQGRDQVGSRLQFHGLSRDAANQEPQARENLSDPNWQAADSKKQPRRLHYDKGGDKRDQAEEGGNYAPRRNDSRNVCRPEK